MCLIFLAINEHPKYRLVVAANRDEFYNRKTATAQYWEEYPEILGGRDIEAGGSWMAMNRKGKISMITNYRDLRNLKSVAPSRGHLVTDFLKTESSVKDYLERIEPIAQEYNGFNLIVGDTHEMGYLSNYKTGIEMLSDGIYGLSNGLLDDQWPKVTRGKEKFTALLQGEVTADSLFELLHDEDRASDDQLPDTGLDIERERALSSMFIKTPGYGSRCSTVILIDQHNHVEFYERNFNLETFVPATKKFEFSV